MDTEGSLVSPYAPGSTHLMFLMKKVIENEPTDYRTISIMGAQTLLSPLGQEKMPEGNTIEEQVRNLIKNAILYQTNEYEKKHRFLKRMLSESDDTKQYRNSGGLEAESIKKPALVWRDTETKHVIFTSDDIISFDWEKQIFSLKLDATIDFLAWISSPRGQYKRLYVEDAQGPIYQAHWVSMISSLGFSGPVYSQLYPNPLFLIANGYPGGIDDTAKGQDPRFALRLKNELKKAGKLLPFELVWYSAGSIIKTTGHDWKNVGEDLRVRVEYFENTFLIGETARAHIFFADGKKTRQELDSLLFIITLIANDGTFKSEVITPAIPVSEIEDDFYECKFAPWEPKDGYDREVQPGSGKIYLAILFQKTGKYCLSIEFSGEFGACRDKL